MGTRTTRIPAHLLEQNKTQLEGKQVQVVLWDGTTKAGTIEWTEQATIRLTDPNMMWYNRKKHRHPIGIEEIREILMDHESEW